MIKSEVLYVFVILTTCLKYSHQRVLSIPWLSRSADSFLTFWYHVIPFVNDLEIIPHAVVVFWGRVLSVPFLCIFPVFLWQLQHVRSLICFEFGFVQVRDRDLVYSCT